MKITRKFIAGVLIVYMISMGPTMVYITGNVRPKKASVVY